MPDEHSNPMAGEWWETRQGGRAYVAASLQNAGQVPYSGHSELTGWSMAGGSISGRSWSREGQWIAGCDGAQDLVKHVPDCTGWDWQPPDWVELDPVNYGWHVLRAGVDQLKSNLCDVWDKIGVSSPVAGKKISDCDRKARCLRKDLPQKPPEPAKPELWNPTAEEKVLLWGAIHNMQAAIGRIEAQLRADDSRDKFFESVL